jgi:hypothetical protein
MAGEISPVRAPGFAGRSEISWRGLIAPDPAKVSSSTHVATSPTPLTMRG